MRKSGFPWARFKILAYEGLIPSKMRALSEAQCNKKAYGRPLIMPKMDPPKKALGYPFFYTN